MNASWNASFKNDSSMCRIKNTNIFFTMGFKLACYKIFLVENIFILLFNFNTPFSQKQIKTDKLFKNFVLIW